MILLVAEYLSPAEIEEEKSDCRHIISVFKLVQDLMAPSRVKCKSQFQLLMDKLPSNHKARWFAGAALNSAEQAMASVISTVLSRLNAFLDSEMEQILCFDTALDTEKFCNEKSALFIVLPEEDLTKYFMVSLMIQQLYREILVMADENGGRLKNRVMFYCDELGMLPAIESLELLFSASRSRRLSMVPIIQSFGQLQKNYGKEGSEVIVDNCQDTIFGDWGITFDGVYAVPERANRKVVYADKQTLEENIVRKHLACFTVPDDDGMEESRESALHTPVEEASESTSRRRFILRT